MRSLSALPMRQALPLCRDPQNPRPKRGKRAVESMEGNREAGRKVLVP